MSNEAEEWVKQLAPEVRAWLDAVADAHDAQELSDEARWVSYALVGCMGSDLRVSMSMRDIANEAGMFTKRHPRPDEAGARHALNELVQHSYLERYSRPGFTNEYAAVLTQSVVWTDDDQAWLEANSISAQGLSPNAGAA